MLAHWLQPFGIKSSQPISGNPGRARGFQRADLEAAVTRYLPQTYPGVDRVGVSPPTYADALSVPVAVTVQQHADTLGGEGSAEAAR